MSTETVSSEKIEQLARDLAAVSACTVDEARELVLYALVAFADRPEDESEPRVTEENEDG